MKLHHKSYGSGHPLVILHGLFGTLDNWHTMSVRLGKMFHVFAVDQRNHGRSPHSDEFNYTVMAKDLLLFMDEHRIETTHLIGHSMGGKTAMQFVKLHPERVSKLVVVDIAPRRYDAHHDHIFDTLCALDLRKHHSRASIEHELLPHFPSLPVRQFLLKNLTRDTSGPFKWKMNLPVIRKNYRCVNRAVTLSHPFDRPTLFIRGSQSSYIGGNDLKEIRRQYLNVQFATIDAGHWLHAEAPEEFFEVVEKFL